MWCVVSDDVRGSTHRCVAMGFAGSNKAVNEDMINRLDAMWAKLEVPSLQRFDFMCKYVRWLVMHRIGSLNLLTLPHANQSNPEHAGHLHAVVELWEAAVQAVLLREKLMSVRACH